MERLIKNLWIILLVFTVFGLLSLIPIGRIQKAYLTSLHNVKQKPQKRVNATYRYVEAIEMGVEDVSKGILGEPPAKYYKNVVVTDNKVNNDKYAYPLYIRDKHNPNILYRIRKP
jgi:hypothetical protein